MAESGLEHECPRCGCPAPRIPSLPVIETDANCPCRGMEWAAGHSVSTRDDMKAMQARGVAMISDRDVDYYARRRSMKLGQDFTKRVEQIRRDARRITVTTE